MKNQNKSISDRRIDSVIDNLETMQERIDSKFKESARIINGLRDIMRRQEKKTSLDFDEVINIKPAFSGDIDAIFRGKKKFRCTDDYGSFEFEIHASSISVYCSNQFGRALFHLNREVLESFQEWIADK